MPSFPASEISADMASAVTSGRMSLDCLRIDRTPIRPEDEDTFCCTEFQLLSDGGPMGLCRSSAAVESLACRPFACVSLVYDLSGMHAACMQDSMLAGEHF